MAPKGRRATDAAEFLEAEPVCTASDAGIFSPEKGRLDMGVKSIRVVGWLMTPAPWLVCAWRVSGWLMVEILSQNKNHSQLMP
jgi:hypothetical protein